MDNNYEPIGLDKFYGGWSVDKQVGAKAQFYYSSHFDFRKNPSQLSVLPAPRNATGGTVIDLVQAMDQTNAGIKYGIGDAGNLYNVNTSGVWSRIANIGQNGAAGIVYRSDVDHLYIAGQTKVARVPRTLSNSSPQINWFENGVSSCTTCTKTGGTNTYTLTAGVDDSLTANIRTFTTDIEPLYKLGVKVISAGSGDWTLTLHDDANTVLGTATISNANISVGKINYFVFSSPIRLQRGDNGSGSALTYHFHLTSSTASGTVATTTNNSLTDCDMELWATALVPTNNGLHPMINFSNFTLIGNGRYIAAYEPLQDNPTTSDFERHKITLPPGFEVCGFAQKNLMCVIGAEKRSTSGEFQEGMLFFWDGVATTYNDFYPVPEGSPESLFSHKNVVHFISGGALYRMRGGDEPIKIWTFRNTDSEYSGAADSTHLYPNMMTIRRGILLIGYPSYTTNLSLYHNIYSLGAVSNAYPDSFGKSYSTSNGNTLKTNTNNLKIGMVKSYGDTLYISWRDDSASPQTYAVDIVDNASVPQSKSEIHLLDFDNGEPSKYKRAGYSIATFDQLPSGVSVRLKYRIDDGSWVYGDYVSTGTYVTQAIETDFIRLTIGLEVQCSGATVTPVIASLYAWVDPSRNTRPIGP